MSRAERRHSRISAGNRESNEPDADDGLKPRLIRTIRRKNAKDYKIYITTVNASVLINDIWLRRQRYIGEEDHGNTRVRSVNKHSGRLAA